MTSEKFFFAAIIGLQLFFLGICRAIFFYSNFFSEGEGGGAELKLGLYVIRHNNKNFNLINIYSAKTVTIEYKKLRISLRCE